MFTVSRRYFLGISALFALAGTRLKALAMTIGVEVSEVVNTVRSTAKDARAPEPVEPGTELPPETEIVTAKESCAELTYADGAVLTIGQRSTATLLPAGSAANFTSGAFRFHSAITSTLTTPLLKIEAQKAEFVVAVAEGQTICGVITGEITCTSIKKGTAARVGAGESIAWISGSFGDGVTKGVFQTADLAVDQGLAAARAAWAPTITPSPTP